MTERAEASRLTYDASGSRQIRATALGRGTHGVSDVGRMIASQFQVAFPHRIWVAGRIGDRVSAAAGALRFTVDPSLSDASLGDDAFALPCMIPGDVLHEVQGLLDRSHDADLDEVVRPGRLVRVGGLLRFDTKSGAVIFSATELDPTPSERELAEAREQTRNAVLAAGLAEIQRSRLPRRAPLEVAVLGSRDDRALQQVQEHFERSSFDVRVRVVPMPLTGVRANRLLADTVRSAAEDNDVILLVRDPGRPLGLATFDDLEVVQAVAEARVPVLTGLGAAATRTATDDVAYVCLPTAAAAADWVLDRLRQARALLSGLEREVDVAVTSAGDRCRRLLDQAEVDADVAALEAVERARLARHRHQLWLLAGCTVLIAAIVGVAFVTDRPMILAGIAVPVALALGVLFWWRQARTTGSRHMSQRDDDFTQVLERLHAVRDELDATSSPERVGVLRELAAELVDEGRHLLGVALDRPVGDEVERLAAQPVAAIAPVSAPAISPQDAPTQTQVTTVLRREPEDKHDETQAMEVLDLAAVERAQHTGEFVDDDQTVRVIPHPGAAGGDAVEHASSS